MLEFYHTISIDRACHEKQILPFARKASFFVTDVVYVRTVYEISGMNTLENEM